MTKHNCRRRLYFHGSLVFFFGMLVGYLLYIVPNPAMANVAHVGAVTNAAFLCALGALWPELRLSDKVATLAYRMQVFGVYLGISGLLMASFWDTNSLLPFGGGEGGTKIQELLSSIALVGFGPIMTIALIVIIYGLRGQESPNPEESL